MSAGLDLDSLIGRSGQLRVRVLSQDEVASYPVLDAQFGDQARTPGIRTVQTEVGGPAFSFVTMAPWRTKVGSSIKGYYVGWWPAEVRIMPSKYDNPDGFIEVQRQDMDAALSAHFRIRDFITHDQPTVWPKYVVLREDLIDKLELVLSALESFGVATQHVVVLSGFRSPQYNARGASEGMARASRHQYGDAADLIVDANDDGRMDDLNFDGRIDFADTQVIDRAVALVEKRFPELVGGLGMYHEMGPTGPFVHIDVRGTRARWTNTIASAGRTASSRSPGASPAVATPSGSCVAEGAMAALCRGIR